MTFPTSPHNNPPIPTHISTCHPTINSLTSKIVIIVLLLSKLLDLLPKRGRVGPAYMVLHLATDQEGGVSLDIHAHPDVSLLDVGGGLSDGLREFELAEDDWQPAPAEGCYCQLLGRVDVVGVGQDARPVQLLQGLLCDLDPERVVGGQVGQPR
jgi:hypothetical protein